MAGGSRREGVGGAAVIAVGAAAGAVDLCGQAHVMLIAQKFLLQFVVLVERAGQLMLQLHLGLRSEREKRKKSITFFFVKRNEKLIGADHIGGGGEKKKKKSGETWMFGGKNLDAVYGLPRGSAVGGSAERRDPRRRRQLERQPDCNLQTPTGMREHWHTVLALATNETKPDEQINVEL